MTYGKRAVTFLPTESTRAAPGGLRPFRRFYFYLFNQFGDRDNARYADKQVDVIHVSTHGGTHAVVLAHVVRQHAEHFRTEHVVLKVRSAFVSRKNDVKPDLCEGLRHIELDETQVAPGFVFGAGREGAQEIVVRCWDTFGQINCDALSGMSPERFRMRSKRQTIGPLALGLHFCSPTPSPLGRGRQIGGPSALDGCAPCWIIEFDVYVRNLTARTLPNMHLALGG
jgi:hypothetical protein